jgi:hypothetical protein
MLAGVGRRFAHDFPLGRVQVGILQRAVAIPAVKGDGPDRAEDAEEFEGVAPSDLPHHHRHQQRGEGSAPTGAEPQHALRPHAFVFRQPGSERFGHVREATRFAGAKEESRYRQGNEAPGPTGGGGEETPPEHDPREHAARSHAIAEVTAGDFEKGVGPAEGGKHRAHLTFVQPQVAGDKRRGEGDGNAVDVGDHCQGDGEYDHPVAYARGPLVLDHARASFMNW